MDRDAYVQKLKARLDQWNADIARLEAQAREAAADVRIHHERELSALREKAGQVHDKLHEVKQAGPSAWEDVRGGVVELWDSLGLEVHDAKSRYKR
ncbi:MAG: hypothetical protein H6828_16520 [Planctomycetes bacterium]|nr:hypothetical protein [Planctomycetota bacterium]